MKYNLSYPQVMDKIREDREKIKSLVVSENQVAEDVNLEIVVSSVRHTYFDRYKIGLPTLKLFGVHDIKSVFRNGDLHSRSTKENPIFAYSFPSGRIKLYRPLSPDRRKK